MEAREIQGVLARHTAWLRGEAAEGEADLRGADLRNAKLNRANLRGADMGGADLCYADMGGADMRNANLKGASLWSANLKGANLLSANLHGACLRGANLRGADMRNANLHKAALRGAGHDACTTWPDYQIPQHGSLVVWKRLCDGTIARLYIPPDAARTASVVGRKCRAERALVEAIEGPDGRSYTTGRSQYDRTNYVVGKWVHPDKYDPDPLVECTHGIHFYLTREEAVEG